MKFFKKLITLCVAIFSSQVFSAPVLWVGDGQGNLGTVNVENGDVNVIGKMGVAMTDIAFDPNGNLYGITFDSLYSIDKNTAATTFIGNTGVTKANALVFDSTGILYTANVNSAIHTLNTTTGASTLVGYSSAYSSGDLAFVNGELFLSSTAGPGDSIWKIDTSNGNGLMVGSTGFNSVYGLASPDSSTLYGVAGTKILDISPTSGLGSVLLDFSGQGLGFTYGSAFYEESMTVSNVPVPSAALLFVPALIGFSALKRKNSFLKKN